MNRTPHRIPETPAAHLYSSPPVCLPVCASTCLSEFLSELHSRFLESLLHVLTSHIHLH